MLKSLLVPSAPTPSLPESLPLAVSLHLRSLLAVADLESTAHLVCENCFTAWMARSSQCPLCRRPLRRGEWEVVKYRRPRAVGEDEEEGNENGDVEMLEAGLEAEAPVKLNLIDPELLAAIDDIDTVAPLSSKSDAIVKHVAYIRR